MSPPLYRGTQRGCSCCLADPCSLPLTHLAHRLASLSRTFPDDEQERHFGTENQKLSSYKEEKKKPQPGAELVCCLAASNRVIRTQFPYICQLHISPGWPHYQEGVPSGGKVASSPSDLCCTSSAAPVGEKGPLCLVVCTEVPGLTLIGLASSSCPRLNPSPEPESVAST